MPTLPKIFRSITRNTLIFLFGLSSGSTQEDRNISWHDWKIVDWDVNHQHKQKHVIVSKIFDGHIKCYVSSNRLNNSRQVLRMCIKNALMVYKFLPTWLLFYETFTQSVLCL